MYVVIVGGGIGGLSLALQLHRVGIECRVFESVKEIKPLGVGLNLLPHAVSELAQLGLLDELLARGVETKDVSLFTSHGQLVYREERGRYAGYPAPQISIHRGDLHGVLVDAVRARLGHDSLVTDQRCVAAENHGDFASVSFSNGTGRTTQAGGDVVIGCDGVNSALRRLLHPEHLDFKFHGTISYRGVTRAVPFLSGKSMAYVGTSKTGKLVAYPIRENIDDEGHALINWVVEVSKEDCGIRDWTRRASHEDFIDYMADWKFDWLDVPAMIVNADAIYEYPVVDRDPLASWGDGRISLLGDAAHPMLPRGSNGSAQAIIDGRVLAQWLATLDNPMEALRAYEDERRPATAKIVLTNRDRAPDAILNVVEQRTGGARFSKLSDVISDSELALWQSSYKQVAGFSLDQLKNVSPKVV
jgi:2-polyprenyl-6-methoxyphenol hydroxylase-like FAD-dependent oxidoreductase